MKVIDITAVAATISLVATFQTPAHAEKTPRPLITDKRITQVGYDQNQVYTITATYFSFTTIEFAADERIKVVGAGDSIGWEIEPAINRIMVKPTEPDARTSLTVVTNKRLYVFELLSSKDRAKTTLVVRFRYPETHTQMAVESAVEPVVVAEQPIGCDLTTANLEYGTSGDKTAIQLRRACDDGMFTFLQFEPQADIPAVYMVQPDGSEALVNSRREGKFVVIERTGRLFVLKNGPDHHLCLENNGMKRARAEVRGQKES